MPFELVNGLSVYLFVHPADLRLNSLQAYLIVQDGLIIVCGFTYSLM